LQRDDRVYVGHMLDASRQALRLAQSVSHDQYVADEVLRLALVHIIQTIGEAARLVSSELRARHPEIPWPAIIGMRHRIVHDYLNVDEEIVWQTVTTELGPLILLLEPLLTDKLATD
jgi:uncharacterized protein with HEPN domain